MKIVVITSYSIHYTKLYEIISIVRMIVQLLLVGVYLQFLFQWNFAWLNLLYIAIMVLVSAITA